MFQALAQSFPDNFPLFIGKEPQVQDRDVLKSPGRQAAEMAHARVQILESAHVPSIPCCRQASALPSAAPHLLRLHGYGKEAWGGQAEKHALSHL